MNNQEILKRKIREAFIIKSKEGQTDKKIHGELSEQFYRFITREPGFTSKNISRGIRDIVTEENRHEIILALVGIYFDYLKRNPNPSNKYDFDIKDRLNKTNNEKQVIRDILSETERIRRMRRCSSSSLFRRTN